MKYVVAVSGGVDSVALLDMLARENKQEIIIAHFDHGIRENSADDAKFVEALAKCYKVPFESERAELGKRASENLARERRYGFLKRTAKKYGAQLVTAHHLDDLIETIAINLTRGTGWRGLAVFGDKTITRPLLAHTKSDLYDYALKHRLEWVEDETNSSGRYLRNRIRRISAVLASETKTELYVLYGKQQNLKSAIYREVEECMCKSRYFYIMIPETAAFELLRQITSACLTRPQLRQLLLAIKTYPARTRFQAGNGVIVHFTTKYFFLDENRDNCYNNKYSLLTN